jgi:hypothetical protein
MPRMLTGLMPQLSDGMRYGNSLRRAQMANAVSLKTPILVVVSVNVPLTSSAPT